MALAVAINIVNGALYIWKVLQGRVRPHPVTWLFWALGPALALAAQLGEGVTWPALVTFITGLNPALIFLVALTRSNARWRVSTFDVACGTAAAVGLGLWLVFRRAELAIAFAITADALASIPTFRKSYSHPETEVWWLYAALSLSGLITMAAIQRWTFAESGFAVYLAALGASLALTVLIRDGRLRPAAEGLRTRSVRRSVRRTRGSAG